MNTPRIYEVIIPPRAQRDIDNLPPDIARDALRDILALAQNPRPEGCKKLKGQTKNLWRIRVRNWRVIYEIRDKELIVVVADVDHRRDVYR